MKRFRVKLVGLGLAVLGGTAVADDWQQPGGPAAAPVRQAGARMPAEPDPVNPIWLPASPRPAAGSVVPAQLPDLGPPQSLPPPTPEQPVGPRSGVLPPGSLPVIPVPPEQDAPPPQTVPPIPPAEVWRGRSDSTAQQPIEPPRPVEQKPPPMPQPTPPGELLTRPRPVEDMLPPRPVTPPAAELPVAPPELMVPAGAAVPGKHGAFGSPPIKLGRDYPSLADLCPSVFGNKAAADGEPVAAPRGFIAGEYLMWWMSGMHIPILATTNPDPRRFGFLGEPGTIPILGPGTFLDSFRQGVRVRGGWWFDDCGSCGIDGSVFVLGRRTAEATFASEEFPVITRPIFSPNPLPGVPGVVVGQFGQAVAVPGVLHGSLSVQADSFLWGADANLRKCLFRDCNTWATWFVGYRNVNLQESLSITENIAVIGASPRIPDPVGTMIRVLDRFATQNHFNGGQIGAAVERRWGAFSLDARGSVAFGMTDQELSIFGAQTRTRPGQLPATYSGGLLAAGPNLGTFNRNKFSVVPEFTFNIGYYVTPNLKVYAGYNFLYWTNVIRPGDQIDGVVDLTFVPNAPAVAPSGQNRPQPLFRQSDLWVNGLQFGVEFRW